KGNGSQLIDFKECPIEPLSVTCMYNGQIHQWLDFDKIERYILVFESDFFALRFFPKFFGLGIGFGLLVTTLAGYIPARKAAKLDPITIFRK
ncbi:ABC transporter permease, partial [Flavobacterium sp. W20_MBD1_R3]|uniref:ABC transporter permease n=1 Tax=Flavobacterium sp. W20_MBD1_R3 TaxID=3240278 RepID=UPI003F91DA4A